MVPLEDVIRALCLQCQRAPRSSLQTPSQIAQPLQQQWNNKKNELFS